MKLVLYLGLSLIGFCIVPGQSAHGADQSLHVTVRDEPINSVSTNLFGQFMEIASWGEPGPEALVDAETGRLSEAVVRKLKWMAPPLTRFPGGTDVGFLDWTDRIDNAPGREGGRPVSKGRKGNQITNHFGYDEFLSLTEQIDTEPLIVVNLRRAVTDRGKVNSAAQHAAALVAYCNARVGQVNQPGDTDWAGIRAKNGRDQPWGVKYWQIGNESWAYIKHNAEQAAAHIDQTPAQWAASVIVKYANAMRKVDPDITLICDAKFGPDPFTQEVLSQPALHEQIDLGTLHRYAPGSMNVVKRGDGPWMDFSKLSKSEVWYAWVSMPAAYNDAGRTLAFPQHMLAEREGWDLACTEWNWNGYGANSGQDPALLALAEGLGAAGFLHGLMRQADRFKLANQSMLLGVSWAISAVKADPDQDREPFIQPTGLVTGFYRRHHGSRRLDLSIQSDLPEVTQQLTIQGYKNTPIQSPLPLIDLLATGDDHTLYLHAINRSLANQPTSLNVDLTAFQLSQSDITQYTLGPKPPAQRQAPRDAATINHEIVDHDGQTLSLSLPARSVSIVEVPLE